MFFQRYHQHVIWQQLIQQSQQGKYNSIWSQIISKVRYSGRHQWDRLDLKQSMKFNILPQSTIVPETCVRKLHLCSYPALQYREHAWPFSILLALRDCHATKGGTSGFQKLCNVVNYKNAKLSSKNITSLIAHQMSSIGWDNLQMNVVSTQMNFVWKMYVVYLPRTNKISNEQQLY